MNKAYRTHNCGMLTETNVGESILVSGWVHYRRDFGGLIFLEIRDHTGLIQVVFDPSENPEAFSTAEKARKEYVISVEGILRVRPDDTTNPNMPTGNVEIVASSLKIISKSVPLPFYPDDHQHVSEEVRLKYRVLDLRRPEMARNLRLRSKITELLRKFLHDNDFVDIETPMLTKATPEGARDYLVPSRTNPGSFFALPQSPQIFKELLMMAGMNRYYQIVRCFRDEDLRADRQPEFTQLDIEMSFVSKEEIMQMMEDLIVGTFKQAIDVDLPTPFKRMTHKEAMDRFGIDRPDLRNPLELVEIADIMRDVEFKVFSDPAKKDDCRIVLMKVPSGGEKLSRKAIDDYTKLVGQYGAKGLAYIKINDLSKGIDGLQSPILKFLPEDAINAILEKSEVSNGDLIFFGAGKTNVVNESMAALRKALGEDLGLVDNNNWQPLWVVDFPMFEKDEAANRWTAVHHPFTQPSVNSVEEFKSMDLGSCLSEAYDLVLNGTELGGGSVRIHSMQMQKAIFEALGISEEESRSKFGFLLDAMDMGTPPLGGIAFGLDRMVMLMVKASSIRDVIAFPKTQSASCLLTNAPTPVSKAQLDELNIKVNEKIEASS